MIGIIGGVGPYAGVYLHQSILDQTDSMYDQDHLPVIHINNASSIPDRTAFLLGRNQENPAYRLIEQLDILYDAGARIIGIPCNTAHTDIIYSVITDHAQKKQNLLLVNMIDELFKKIKSTGIRKIGLLATLGSYQSGLFESYGARYGIEVVSPDDKTRKLVHDTIYNERDGLKSNGRINNRIHSLYESIISMYRSRDIHSLILGCTEISMAYPESKNDDCITFRTVDILARALIREFRTLKPQQIR